MSAILSDTLMFKSPTCTQKDIDTVKELALICEEIDYEEYGMNMLIAGTSLANRSPYEILTTDMKEFSMNGINMGIAQVNTVDVAGLLNKKADLERAMKEINKNSEFSMFILIITDIIKSGSYAMVIGDFPELLERAFNVQLENNLTWLEGVVSRKKQIVPFLMAASQSLD